MFLWLDRPIRRLQDLEGAMQSGILPPATEQPRPAGVPDTVSARSQRSTDREQDEHEQPRYRTRWIFSSSLDGSAHGCVAQVFGPNLLRPEVETMETLMTENPLIAPFLSFVMMYQIELFL
jgi:hypothetical protein